MVALLILNLGTVLGVSFEKVFLLENPLTYSKGDIITTYLYRIGLESGSFSLAAAIGLFESVIGLVLIVSANLISKPSSGDKPVVEILNQAQPPKPEDLAGPAGKPTPVDVSRALRSRRIQEGAGLPGLPGAQRRWALARGGRDPVALRQHRGPVAEQLSGHPRGTSYRLSGRLHPAHVQPGAARPDLLDELQEHPLLHGRLDRGRDGADTTYALSWPKRNLKGHRILLWIAVFTLFFNGGLIPNYVLVTRGLHLSNTVWAIALPSAISVFNLLVMRAFFENLPGELEEAAAVDGMSTYGILFKIVIPLSKAVLATMVLFYSVRSGTHGSPRSSTWTT